MACGAISEPFLSRRPTPWSRVARGESRSPTSSSEKQYQIPAGLARNCRAFLIGRPGPRPDAFAPPRGSAEEAPQPNPVSQSPCLKVLQEGPDRCLLFIVHRAGIEVHEKELRRTLAVIGRRNRLKPWRRCFEFLHRRR